MGKLNVALLRYLSKEDFRVLTAVRLEHQDVNTRMRTDHTVVIRDRMLMLTDTECISSVYLQCFRGTGFRRRISLTVDIGPHRTTRDTERVCILLNNTRSMHFRWCNYLN